MVPRDSDLSSAAGAKTFCDLTQSWSEVGGGVRTYLLHKRRHILEATPHRHLMIIPGARDEIVAEDRATTVYVASPHVPGSPNYRLLLRNRAVHSALNRFRPDLIECQDAYNLPWVANGYRRRHPETALVAAYMTDLPTVYMERPISKVLGGTIGRGIGRLGYAYCGMLYRRFDAVFALSENGGVAKLRGVGVPQVDIVPLGVELGEFGPAKRDPKLRQQLGLGDSDPLIIYVGRLDGEKKPDVVTEAFRRLPDGLNARLALIGEGPLKADIAALGDRRIILPGYVSGRPELARWLASADLYASGMADETFGVSIVEAQASGLPVVGVAAGAMLDRVTPDVGRLGPVGDAETMAANMLAVLRGDRETMSERARQHALQFSWDRSMDALFSEVYPAAFERRLAALRPTTAGVGALAGA